MTPQTPHDEMQALWDAYRDGELDPASTARFEKLLADHPADASLYRDESRWLGALRGDDDSDADLADTRDFVQSTLLAWQRPHPIATLRRHSGSLIAAATILIVVGLMWVAGRKGPLDRPRLVDADHPTRVVKREPSSTDPDAGTVVAVDDESTSPVSRLVLSVSGSVDRQRQHMRQAQHMLSGEGLRTFLQRNAPKAPAPPPPPADDSEPG